MTEAAAEQKQVLDLEQDDLILGYQRRIKAYQKKRDQIDQVISQIALWRLLSFLAFLFFAISGWYDQNSLFLWLSVPCISLYAFFAWRHEKLYFLLPRAEQFILLNQECLSRVQQKWGEIKDGGEWALDDQSFIEKELQLFGDVSLYKAINHCSLFGSKLKLTQRLKQGISPELSLTQIQDAVKALVLEKNLRARVWVEGKLSGLNQKEITSFQQWSQSPSTLSTWIFRFSQLAPWLVIATWVQAILSLSFGYLTLWQPFLMLQLVIYLLTTAGCAKEYEVLIANQHRPIQALELIFKELETKRFQDEYLQKWQQQMVKVGLPSTMIQSLSKTANALAVKHSALLFGILNTLFLWELRYVKEVSLWKKEHAHRISGLLEAVYDFEVLSSMAFFAEQHPSYCTAKLIDDDPLSTPISVQELGHPLFASKTRVTNSYTMQPPFKLLFVTGSNMSGKSSFLRALGINLKLAQMGSVVCGKKFEMINCDIATSIQVNDDPSQGWSRFYAEVRRIKSIMQRAKLPASKPLFFLIDEMLSGTNSYERQLAAQSITKQLLQTHAFGLITTHDTELTKLAEYERNLIDCGYFSDHFDGTRLTFDYQLKPGVAQSKNAIRVLELEGIKI